MRGILSPYLEWTQQTNGDMDKIKAKPGRTVEIVRFLTKIYLNIKKNHNLRRKEKNNVFNLLNIFDRHRVAELFYQHSCELLTE